MARIGAYSLDLAAQRWVSSDGLDAIFGIDASFDRSVEGWASLVHPHERVAVLAYFADEVVGRGQPFNREYRIVRADTGAERWVHGRGELEFDATGRPVTMFGTIADITDQRRADEALVASELRYETIFEGTAEAILIAEVATRRFRWVNSAACALLGYSRGDLLELTIDDIHPAADRPTILDRFFASEEGKSAGHSRCHACGKTAPCCSPTSGHRAPSWRGCRATSHSSPTSRSWWRQRRNGPGSKRVFAPVSATSPRRRRSLTSGAGSGIS